LTFQKILLSQPAAAPREASALIKPQNRT